MDSNVMESQSVTVMESGQSSRNNKRRKRSRCWESFEELPTIIDGKRFARCTKCGKELTFTTASGIRHLLRHHDTCASLGISPHSAIRSSTFKHDEFCELLIEAIVNHDLPLCLVDYEGIKKVFDYISLDLHLPSRNTVKNHVMKMYETEKLKVRCLLDKSRGRICLTSDIWTSHTTDGYLALTAHFLDAEWNLQKKLLAFCHMPPPHTGNALVEKINSLICDWGIDQKLFSITLDNASANDSSVEKLKTRLNFRRLLLLDGNFFHVRCSTHILNLIVQDGLKVIYDSVAKVRECFKYIKGSVSRRYRFLECIEQVGLTTNRRMLRQDVPTRWNSTYHMLESALYFRQALGQYALVDSDFKTCPTLEEWDRVEMISKFLGEFHDVTVLFSGSSYPTSNLFFPKVFKIQHSIQQAKLHTREFMKQMGNVMGAKFDKYWSTYNLILGIAVVMDPRFKMTFVEFAYGKLYGANSTTFVDFKESLESLFDAYADRCISEDNARVQLSQSCSYSQEEDILLKEFDEVDDVGTTNSNMRIELNSYLEEKKLKRKSELDILGWWKAQQSKYPILSQMASDILVIPISTVASESAFSIGGRVLDQYRSSLLPETMEALLCCRDWLFEKSYEDVAATDLTVEDALNADIV